MCVSDPFFSKKINGYIIYMFFSVLLTPPPFIHPTIYTEDHSVALYLCDF